MRATYDAGRGSRRDRGGAGRDPERLHPRRRAARLRSRRLPLRVHRRDRGVLARPGPRLPRRQDPADHPRRRPGAGEPRPGLAGVDVGAPQRAGTGLRRRRHAVGLGVRGLDLGRAEPDREGPQLRLARGRGRGRPGRVHRSAGGVVDRGRLPLRARLPRRARVDGRAAGSAALAGRRLGRRGHRPAGLLRRRVRPDAHRRRRPRRAALGHHVQPGRPRRARPRTTTGSWSSTCRER